MSVMAASANYNEVYNAVTLADGTLGGDPSQKDPMFCWDTHYPERLSRLTLTNDFTAPCASPTLSSSSAVARVRNSRTRRNRNAARFKTQPITFDEIKEVDEDAAPTSATAMPSEEAKESLKSQFANFSKSMDGLVVAPFARRGGDAGGAAAGAVGGAGSVGGAAPPSSTCTAAAAVAAASYYSSEEEKSADGLHRGGSATSATIQRQQFRQRRKKRHTKSIEEAPELDKATDKVTDKATDKALDKATDKSVAEKAGAVG